MAHSEFEMSLNRFVFCFVIGLYVALVGGAAFRPGLIYIGAYTLFSTLLFLSIRHRPEASPTRAVVALIGDFTTISFEMHVGGASTSVFYPIYLWVILGNGFRFGLRFLFIAMGAALTGFVLACRTTPFWLAQHYLTWGLFAGLIIVPGYGGTLIRKLSAARHEAEEANRAKSMFLASVSHSVRTPLNAILGTASLLQDTRLDAEQSEFVHKLRIGADILTSLITGILDFTQIEANRMPVRLSPVDVSAILHDLRELLAPQARAKGLKLFVHVGPGVPPQVLGDPRHLHEILVNLVSNALKFTSDGSVVIAVSAEPLPERTRLLFSVSDTGIGIRGEALDRIFDSFTQADSSIIDRFGGTGLGLTIAKRLVLLLGGTIGVTSEVGAGSVFSFSFDCAVADATPTHTTRPSASRPPIILFPDVTRRSQIATRLGDLVGPLTVAESVSELVSLVAASGKTRPILILECNAPAARSDILIPLLMTLDRWGDLPRILIADTPDPVEAVPLRRHVTTWIGNDLDPDAVQAALRICAPQRAPQKSGPVRELAVSSRRLEILVADDNVTNQKLVAKILERAGHNAHVVRNGEDAVIALGERHFDLALLDLNMPVMNGLDAAMEYRVQSLGQRSVPIVALTADATPETARKCADAGMVDCITKPVVPATLIARIEELVPQSAAQDPRATPASPVANIEAHPRFRQVLPPLDRQVLDDLERLGGAGFVTEMLEGFVQEAQEVIEQLARAASDSDLLQFRGHAHALRSASANMGARALHELCGECRDLSILELNQEGTRIAQSLRRELARVRQEMLAQEQTRHVVELGQ